MIRRVLHTVGLILGKVPSCDWVQDRLPAYCAWDLPMREFAAIETHLHECRACAAEHEELKPVIQELTRMGMAAQGLMSPEQHAEALIARIRATEAPRSGGRRRPVFARSRLAALATAALLLIVAAPVLAYVGHVAWEALVGPADKEVVSVEPSGSSVPSDGSADDAAKSTTASESNAVAMPTDTVEATLGAHLDRITEDAIIKMQVDAMLPHTEEEYEAWARREYPHIMWLYDVLAGEAPAKTMDSPAGRMVRFATDPNGNPTITLPDADGNMVTLRAVRDGGTLTLRDISADPSGGFSSCVSFSSEKETWDGKPVNIPAWAERLYANTPESERPTGWRALLIYSGEIFKFDCPESLDEPNCRPTAEAVWAAAEVPGFDLDVAAPQAERDDPPEESITEYASALATDIPQAQAVVAYVHTSAVTVRLPEFDEIADSANTVLEALRGASEMVCRTKTLLKAVANLLETWGRQIGNICDDRADARDMSGQRRGDGFSLSRVADA